MGGTVEGRLKKKGTTRVEKRKGKKGGGDWKRIGMAAGVEPLSIRHGRGVGMKKKVEWRGTGEREI